MTSKQVVVAQVVAVVLLSYGAMRWFERERCLEVYGDKLCVIHDYDMKKLDALKALWSK